MTSIGDYAFYGCYKLVEVYNLSELNITAGSWYDGYVAYYAKAVYTSKDSVSKLKTDANGYLFYENGDEAYLIGYTGTKTDLTLPEKSPSGKAYGINQGAFYGCRSLTSITIPSSVTSIGGDAFLYCMSLTGVYITDFAAWCGISFNGDYSNPLSYAHNLYLNGTLVTNLVIPEGVTSIGSSAFENCTSLTSITIPASVTSIGFRAFSYCTSLTSITIPSSVTSIGGLAFFNCTSLTSITFTGTKAQWSSIEKGSDWAYNTGSFVVHCTDGDV